MVLSAWTQLIPRSISVISGSHALLRRHTKHTLMHTRLCPLLSSPLESKPIQIPCSHPVTQSEQSRWNLLIIYKRHTHHLCYHANIMTVILQVSNWSQTVLHIKRWVRQSIFSVLLLCLFLILLPTYCFYPLKCYKIIVLSSHLCYLLNC